VLVGGADANEIVIERSEEVLRIPEAIADRWWVRRRTLVRAGVATVIALVLPFLPWLSAPHRTYVLAHVAVFALAALSLTVLSGWGGHLSLGQFAIVAVGAFTAARLAPRGWSLLATMVVAAAVGAAFAIVAGLPAARSRGLAFAVTSLALAVVGPTWLFQQSWLAPPGTTSAPAAYQAGVGRLATQRTVYFVALAILVVVGFALVRLRGSNAGRVIVAVRDNPPTAAALGFSPTHVRLTTFALSGALAAAAGVLWLAVNRNISGQVISPDVSQLLLAAVVIGGVSSIAGAIVGALGVFGLPLLLTDSLESIIPYTAQLQLFFAGAGLLQTQIVNPGGIASLIRRRGQRLLDRAARGQASTPPTPRAAARRPPVEPRPVDASAAVLSVREIRVDFDGVRAVDGVALHVDAGEIVGVIGANGAGKTTLLDAVCGLVPSLGTIEIDGHDVSSWSTARRSRLGVSRGFQDARLFPALTVRETVELALDRRHPTAAIGALVGAPWARFAARLAAEEAEEIIERFGLTAFADAPGDQLSTGTRHLCDIAAQVATEPRLMILDEPTSGIAQRETDELRGVLRSVADEVGCAMLVVEHHLPFLMAVADRIYCLDRGRVIAEGTPSAVRDDPAVVTSYLGVAASRRSVR
jgi:ABC-type branched-subunit amino acid transport system ATPase component/ABC-type branched-subunit amino acid transport system permease subunit